MPVTLPSLGSSGWGTAINAAFDEILDSGRVALEYPILDKGGRLYNAKAYNVTGDGTTLDTAALSTLITTVSGAGGGIIALPGGTYLVKTTTTYAIALDLPDNVSLVGIPGKTIIKGDASSSTGIQLVRAFGDNCRIHGITFDIPAITDAVGIVTQTCDAVHIRGCHFQGGVIGVLVGGGTTNITIEGNTSRGTVYGVLSNDATGLHGVKVLSNTFNGFNVGGTANVEGDGISFNQPNQGFYDFQIIGNRVLNFDADAGNNKGMGIAIAFGRLGVVADNTVSLCELDGIHVEDGSREMAVHDNIVYSCGRAGISVQTGLTVGACSRIDIHDNQVAGCCLTAGSAALEVGGFATQHRCRVAGNTVYANGRAGATMAGIGLWMDNGIVTGNQVWDTIGATTYGISFEGLGSVIGQNRCGDDQGVKTQDFGLRLTGTNTDTLVDGNNLKGNGTASMTGTGSGETLGTNIT